MKTTKTGRHRTCPICSRMLNEAVLGGQCPTCLSQMVLETPPVGLSLLGAEIGHPRKEPVPMTLRYFGDYFLEAEIGRGGMGIVYRARQLRLNRTVALKLIAPEQLSAPKVLARFRAEAEAAANLDHPNIVPVYETGEYEGRHYFSMKFIEGASLAAKIAERSLPLMDPRTGSGAPSCKTQNTLRQAQIAALLAKVAEAVHYAHQRGILHRDLKPGNILIDSAGEPHVSDFGLAKRVGGDSSLTLSGELLGTPAYMAPEQALGKAAEMTVAADVYSLGAILFELLTTQPPFARATQLETFHAILNDNVRSPRSINRGVAKDLETICLKCLEKEPSRRYSSAAELADELQRFTRGEPIQSRPVTRPEQLWRWAKRRPALATMIVLLHMVFVVGIVGILSQWRRAEVNASKARANEFSARQNLYAADIVLAKHALEADNLLQARDLLRRHVPKAGETDLRGFEWRYLWQQCQGEELFSLPGHTNTAPCLAFLPRGNALVSGSDGFATVWDLSTRRALASLVHCADNDKASSVTSPGSVQTICCSPNGDWLVTGSQSELCIWDGRSFKLLRRLPEPTIKAQFSPDSRYLIVSSTNVSLLQAETWERIAGLELPAERPTISLDVGIGFSPDGASIALVLNDGVHILSIPEMKETQTCKETMPRFRFVAFAPDGRTLATCTLGYEIKLWDLENASEVRRLTGHSDNITSAAFSGDGKVLITTSLDQTIRKWDVQTGKLLRTFRGHPQEVWDGVFSPDRTLFASAAKDGGIKVWDTTAAPPLEPLLSSTTPIGFHANGDLVCLGTNGFLAALDPHTLITNSARQIPAHSVSQFSARLGSLMNDGRTAVFATEEGTLRALDLEDGQFRCSIECRHPGFVAATDSQVIATRTSGRTVTLWQMPSGDPICVASNTSLALGFSDDERRLLIWGDNSPILLTKTGSTWAKASELPLRISVQGKAAFSPDGRMVASGDWGSLVSAFALPSGERLVSFVGHKREMCDLCFSPDSRTLATISDDNTVRLWQVATGRELMRFSMFLKDPQVAKLALRFSPDGRTLVAEGFDSERHNSRVFFAPSFGEIAVAEDTDYRAVTKTAADWLAVGKALVKRNRKEEALEALSEAIVRSDGNSLPTSVRTTALCYRSNLLAEIVQDVQRGVKVTHQ